MIRRVTREELIRHMTDNLELRCDEDLAKWAERLIPHTTCQLLDDGCLGMTFTEPNNE